MNCHLRGAGWVAAIEVSTEDCRAQPDPCGSGQRKIGEMLFEVTELGRCGKVFEDRRDGIGCGILTHDAQLGSRFGKALLIFKQPRIRDMKLDLLSRRIGVRGAAEILTRMRPVAERGEELRCRAEQLRVED